MNSIYAYGNIIKSIGKVKLVLDNQQIFMQELLGLNGRVVVTVEEDRGKRSAKQNRYLWGVAYKAVAMGLTEIHGEEISDWWVHCFYKKEFLSHIEHHIVAGIDIEVDTASTAALDTKEFEQYTEKIRRHAATVFGIDVPTPNE